MGVHGGSSSSSSTGSGAAGSSSGGSWGWTQEQEGHSLVTHKSGHGRIASAPECNIDIRRLALIQDKYEFDCKEGFNNWVLGWSLAKQQFCCRYCNDFYCEIPTTTTTNAWEQTWFASRSETTTTTMMFTTSTLTTTMSTKEPAPFDCEEGKENSGKGWSVWKKQWCCQHEEKGCPIKGDVNGVFRVQHVLPEKLRMDPLKEKLMWQGVKQAIIEVANCRLQRNMEGKGVNISMINIISWESSTEEYMVRFGVDRPDTISEYDLRQCLQCENLLPPIQSAVRTCPDIGKFSRFNPVVLGCRVEHAIVRIPCTCSNGEAVQGDKCPAGGGEHCGKCEEGFQLTATGICAPNTCTCENGVGGTGRQCPINGEEACGFCHEGFHLEKSGFGEGGRSAWRCKLNMCKCSNGVRAQGSACEVHGSTDCEHCFSGYHVDRTKSCSPNACSCPNGMPVADGSEECLKQGGIACASCHPGYHRNPLTRECEANKCTCDGGVAAVGTQCRDNGASVCVSCFGENAFLTHDKQCGSKTCICPNGHPVSGTECTTNRGIMCETCDHGFTLYKDPEAKQCVAAGCTCAGGMPASSCGVDGEEKCQKCDEGYTLKGDKCVENECTCTNGEAAKGKLCLKDGLHVCATCKEGYSTVVGYTEVAEGGSRVQVTCEPNVCTCDNGTPATPNSSPICHTGGAVLCTSCKNDGFVGRQCREKKCTCEDGVAAVGQACPADGMEHCASCNTGYEAKKSDLASGSTTCTVMTTDVEDAFDCDAGFSKRLIGWSPLKKDWCCTNKGVGCTRSNAMDTDVCNPHLSKPVCDLISCCMYNQTRGCQPKVGGEVCMKSKVIQLAVSAIGIARGLCMEPALVDAKAQVVLQDCNEQALGEHEGPQTWEYNSTSLQLENLKSNQCIKLVADGQPVELQACSGNATQEEQITITSGVLQLGEDHCLHAERNERGAKIIAWPCNAAFGATELDQWNVPSVGLGS